jgi:hypothetical protein
VAKMFADFGLGSAGLSTNADKRLCQREKLIRVRVIYCLILISDSIMVPCYGCITLNTKGCAKSCFFVEKKKRDFFLTFQENLDKASFSGKEGS